MKIWITRWFVLLNAAIAALYLWVGHSAWWLEPELAGVPGASGGSAFVWALATAYTLAAVLLLAASALAWHLYNLRIHHIPKLTGGALLVVPLWMMVAAVDFAHH